MIAPPIEDYAHVDKQLKFYYFYHHQRASIPLPAFLVVLDQDFHYFQKFPVRECGQD